MILARQLLRIRTEMNECVMACRIPAEVLSRILHFNLDKCSDSVRASHVCMFWRAVAVSYGALWTYIDKDTPLSLARCKYKRAGNAPLTLRYHDDDYAIESWLLEWIDEHSRRFVEVDIALDGPDMDEILPYFFEHPWPQLQSLRLETTSFRDAPVLDIASLDGHPPPALRTLVLSGVSLRSWDNPALFSNLQQLQLEDDMRGDSYRISTLLKLLHDCSGSLQRVFITNLVYYTEPHLETFAPDAEEVHISLDHVTTIELDGLHCVDTAFILSHLTIPRTTNVDVSSSKFGIGDSNRGPFASLPQDTSRLAVLMDRVPRVELKFTQADQAIEVYHEYTGEGSKAESSHNTDSTNEDPEKLYFSLHASRANDPLAVQHSIHYLSSALWTRRMQTLQLTFSDLLRYLTEDDWVAGFSCLQNLDTIIFEVSSLSRGGRDQVTLDDTRPFLHALAASPTRPLLVPSLTDLDFYFRDQAESALVVLGEDIRQCVDSRAGTSPLQVTIDGDPWRGVDVET